MVWTSLWPDGSQSVKQNEIPGQGNTTYVKTTLNNDHFWDISGGSPNQKDGYHRKVSMQNYASTANGASDDPDIPAGMDATFYLKTTSGRVQGFYKNANGIYQYVPAFLTGSANLTASYQNIVSVPDNTYGEIYFFKQDNSFTVTNGYFKAAGGVCQAYCNLQTVASSSVTTIPMRYGNEDDASGLNLRVRTRDAPVGTYQYRITYWTM